MNWDTREALWVLKQNNLTGDIDIMTHDQIKTLIIIGLDGLHLSRGHLHIDSVDFEALKKSLTDNTN